MIISLYGPTKTLHIEIPKNDFLAYFWGLKCKKLYPKKCIKIKISKNQCKVFESTLDNGL